MVMCKSNLLFPICTHKLVHHVLGKNEVASYSVQAEVCVFAEILRVCVCSTMFDLFLSFTIRTKQQSI